METTRRGFFGALAGAAVATAVVPHMAVAPIMVRLPIDSDLCVGSLRWAHALLREEPRQLVVTHSDVPHAREAVAALRLSGCEVVVDRDMGEFGWRLVGDTSQVYTPGA